MEFLIYALKQSLVVRRRRAVALTAILGLQFALMVVVSALTEASSSQDTSSSIESRSFLMIAVLASCVIAFASTYRAMLTRRAEIGVLRSMGASRLFIVGCAIAEAIVFSILGAFAGLLVSFALRLLIRDDYPSLPISRSLPWALWATAVTLFAAIVGAGSAVWFESRRDPADLLPQE
ncbi:MAG: FtsX-like permease family protein [Candidatus Acidiferrales bacterium]